MVWKILVFNSISSSVGGIHLIGPKCWKELLPFLRMNTAVGHGGIFLNDVIFWILGDTSCLGSAHASLPNGFFNLVWYGVFAPTQWGRSAEDFGLGDIDDLLSLLLLWISAYFELWVLACFGQCWRGLSLFFFFLYMLVGHFFCIPNGTFMLVHSMGPTLA